MEMPKILGYKVITKGRGTTIDVKLEQIDVISKDKVTKWIKELEEHADWLWEEEGCDGYCGKIYDVVKEMKEELKEV